MCLQVSKCSCKCLFNIGGQAGLLGQVTAAYSHSDSCFLQIWENHQIREVRGSENPRLIYKL